MSKAVTPTEARIRLRGNRAFKTVKFTGPDGDFEGSADEAIERNLKGISPDLHQ